MQLSKHGSTPTACLLRAYHRGSLLTRKIRSTSSSAFPYDVFTVPKKKHTGVINPSLRSIENLKSSAYSKYIEDRQIMSGPTRFMDEGEQQKLGTTRLLFQGLNQLKDDFKELLYHDRNVSVRGSAMKVNLHDNNFERKYSENYTAPDRNMYSEFMLPDINKAKIGGRAEFKKIFNGKIITRVSIPHSKAMVIRVPGKKQMDSINTSPETSSHLSTHCTTKASNENSSTFKRKDALQQTQKNNIGFLQKVIMSTEKNQYKSHIRSPVLKTYDACVKDIA